MFGKQRFDNIVALFSDQFEPSGSDYTYRRSSKGVAIRVTLSERNDFIATFDKHIRYSSWFIIVSTIFAIALTVAFVPDVHSALGETVTYISVACIIGICFAVFYWAWGAPMRALARRPVIGQPLTRIEARQLALSKISYGQLALAAFGGVWIGWTQAEKYDALNGWGLAWLGFGALLVTLAGVQAGRKWIVERKA